MAEFYERSPTRVDLAGGTLDCPPLFLFLPDPVTVNVAINVYTHAWLHPRNDAAVILDSVDQEAKIEYKDLSACLADTDPRFALFRAMLRFWRPESGFSLRTRSESPVGGGLGGSSSLCISLFKVFSRWLGRHFETSEIVRIASGVEAQVLLKPTGTQDYFPPLLGNLCFIHYEVAGPRAEVLAIPEKLFDDHFMLVYTGRSHHSGINNWQVIKNYLDGDENTIRCMRDLAQISKGVEQAMRLQHWDELPGLFAQEYRARTALSEGFSSPEIVKLRQLAEACGSQAKICGAGGGGCVMLWADPGQRETLAQRVVESGFTILGAKPCEA